MDREEVKQLAKEALLAKEDEATWSFINYKNCLQAELTALNSGDKNLLRICEWERVTVEEQINLIKQKLTDAEKIYANKLQIYGLKRKELDEFFLN